jgi:hypothetical protein
MKRTNTIIQSFTAVLALGVHLATAAQGGVVERQLRAVAELQIKESPISAPIALAQYQYVPPANPALSRTGLSQGAMPLTYEASATSPAKVIPNAPPEQQRILDLSAAGDYQAAGTEGLVLLSNGKVDESLQLIIANSLAWTGRTDEAVPAYSGLVNGIHANAANVGIANIQRWRGMDHLALPQYQAVLVSEPDNAGALEGVELATRELVPRTTVSLGGSQDSSNMERKSTAVNHRWRDSSGARIMEIELGGVRDSLPGVLTSEDNALFRYQALDFQMKPSFELSMPTKDNPNVFGGVHFSLPAYKASFDIARINWGKSATNPRALAAQLTANQAGMTVGRSFPIGDLTGRVDLFDVSDANQVITSSLRLASSWRPMGSQVKPFVGLETRDSSFNSPNYWSPQQGFGSAYAGFLAEWGKADWSLFLSAQVGAPLYGEAGNSWSLSGGGKQWLSNSVAINLSLWAMSSYRDNARYEAQAANISLEKLWR